MNNGKKDIIDGEVCFPDKKQIPFHYEDGYLKLIFRSAYSIQDNITCLKGHNNNMMFGGNVYFHFPMMLENYGSIKTVDEKNDEKLNDIIIGSLKQNVDYYIYNYEENARFTHMTFSFPELTHFVTCSDIYEFDSNEIVFKRKIKTITETSFIYKNENISLSINQSPILNITRNDCSVEIKTSLILNFNETNDIDFLLGLYRIIYNLFSFLCNRQNLDLSSTIIMGIIYADDEISTRTSQTLNVINKYRDELEPSSVLNKTINSNLLKSSFTSLVSMFSENKISIHSIHTSTKTRNLIDLKQCLNITAAFEFYQRTFLPLINSEITYEFINDLKEILQKYINEHSGRIKKKASDFYKNLTPDVSLKEKICKVIDGYNGWQGLDEIISEWFHDDIEELALIANIWRNELAHEKHEYEPDKKVVTAIRLIEFLNYCIVFRQAGYEDNEIKLIIQAILI